MTEPESLIIFTLVAVALFFVTGAAAFLHRLRAAPSNSKSHVEYPKAAVLLSLRGADPHLNECLRALIGQAYPDFWIYIVVDSESDPAWTVVYRTLEETGAHNVSVVVLTNPPATCSLKCSALLQMLNGLGEDVQVVALIDSDIVPHATWLRELTVPLSDNQVGATFGIPWYSPPKAHWASIVRKVSWAPAAVLMSLFGWVWGGSAALPARVFRHPTLADRWSRSVSSDAPVQGIVEALGLKTQWVPTLVMPNCEEGRVRALLDHLTRSLSTSRLYLRLWPLIILAAFLASGLFLLAVVIIIFLLFEGDIAAAQRLTVVLSTYWVILMLIMMVVDARIRRLLRSNGFSAPAATAAVNSKTLMAVPFAHGIYFAAALKALIARSLTWRGVRYSINGKWNIRLVENNSIIRHTPPSECAMSKQTGYRG